jgi:hypothetical protein
VTNTKAHVISALYAFVPYIPLAWIYSALEGGSARAFWKGLGVLIAAKLLFTIIEAIGSTVAWRLHGRRRLISQFVEFLNANNLPKREFAQDDLGRYLARLSDKKYDESVRRLAIEINQSRLLMENAGPLVGMRYAAAWEAALDIYSPKE